MAWFCRKWKCVSLECPAISKVSGRDRAIARILLPLSPVSALCLASKNALLTAGRQASRAYAESLLHGMEREVQLRRGWMGSRDQLPMAGLGVQHRSWGLQHYLGSQHRGCVWWHPTARRCWDHGELGGVVITGGDTLPHNSIGSVTVSGEIPAQLSPKSPKLRPKSVCSVIGVWVNS